MKILKPNQKIIAAFAAGAIITGSVATYGTYTYLASNITYTKEGTNVSTVAEALNDLYDKKKNYILPTGTKTITEKASQIDVSNFKYADTTGISEEGKIWVKDIITLPTDIQRYEHDFGFVPSLIYLKSIEFDPGINFISYDSGSDFYIFKTNTGTVTKASDQTLNLSGTKLTFSWNGSGWNGSKIVLYAVK